MRKIQMSKKLIAAALAVSLAASAVSPAGAAAVAPVAHPVVSGGVHTPWLPFVVMGCATGIILAAMAANSRDNRELLAPEAWTCGLLFLSSQPRSKGKARGR
jgi:hypothetical protein